MAPPVGFEPTILISKTSALGQTKLRGNNNLTLQIFKEQDVYCTRTKILVNHYVVLKQQTKNP